MSLKLKEVNLNGQCPLFCYDVVNVSVFCGVFEFSLWAVAEQLNGSRSRGEFNFSTEVVVLVKFPRTIGVLNLLGQALTISKALVPVQVSAIVAQMNRFGEAEAIFHSVFVAHG